MKNLISRQPVWFVIVISLFELVLGLLIFIIGSAIGLPEEGLQLVALAVTVAVPLLLIWWLGWWQDAGFVKTTQNAPALAFPLLGALFLLAWFGTVALEGSLIIRLMVVFFLTGLSEEALSRGLFLRALLPRGKWQAALIPAVLFGAGHITQFLFQGMSLSSNLLQIVDATFFGILYAAMRLRVNNIWPLIILHMLQNVFAGLAGIFGVPNAIGFDSVPTAVWIIRWALMLIPGIYLIARRPATATIDGQAVG